MLKIAITGPESTGKSALTKSLAEHYACSYVNEYAREYLASKKEVYTQADLDIIAMGQLELEKSINNGNLLFCDTEMTVMKIWSEHAYGTCSPLIKALYQKQQYDLYLLTQIDLPWEPDPLREHPTLRPYFFNWFEKELMQEKRPYKIVTGEGNDRLLEAIRLVDSFLAGKK